MHHAVVLKRELLKKSKLLLFKSIFVAILTYGLESWIMSERMRWQIQASAMKFLRKTEGVMIFDKLRYTAIRTSLNIKLLQILRIQRSQL